jgi:hypothetical protein
VHYRTDEFWPFVKIAVPAFFIGVKAGHFHFSGEYK